MYSLLGLVADSHAILSLPFRILTSLVYSCFFSPFLSSLTVLNTNLEGKVNRSDFVSISGVFTSSGVLTISHNLGTVPYLLSAQIQLENGVWNDMRLDAKFMRISVNSSQLRVDRDSNNAYVGYQVRFLLSK